MQWKPAIALVALMLAPFGASVAARSQPVEAAPAASDEQDEASREIETLRAVEVTPLVPDEALDKRHVGKLVRWAGAIYGIDGRCLTILFARSGDHGEPRWTAEPTYQAFVACGSGGYDPELVQAHTNVTIIGRVTGKQYIGMGGGGADGPVLRIEKLYRWSDCLAGDDSPICKRGFLEPGPVEEE
ncbi:Outer membrane lipoprotein Slp family protein [Sphingopyxis sp. YR583]|nr:Outer membrane lipoprotein Slp family protein [Sphingopyxis sp. YR583]